MFEATANPQLARAIQCAHVERGAALKLMVRRLRHLLVGGWVRQNGPERRRPGPILQN